MHCPHCGKFNPALIGPVPGRIAICVFCGELGTVTDRLRLSAITTAELTTLLPAAQLRGIVATQRAVVGAIAAHNTKN